VEGRQCTGTDLCCWSQHEIQQTSYTDTLDCRSTLLMRSNASFASSKLQLGTGLGSGHGEMFLNLGIQYIIRQYLRTGWPRLPKMLSRRSSISTSGITPWMDNVMQYINI
jgi:hypothetical protein